MDNLNLGNRIGIFAVIWLSFCAIPIATTANEVYGIVATESTALNIRAGTDTNSPIIAKAKRGATLRILGSSGSWYQVQLPNGAVGYVSSAYIRLTGVSTANESYGVVATESTPLNIRTGPGEKYQVIGTAQKGITLRILGKEGSWYKIQDGNGLVGYASSDYMRLLSGNNSAPSYSPPAIPQQQPNYGNESKQQPYQSIFGSIVKEICNQPPIDDLAAARFSQYCNSGNSSLPLDKIADYKKMGCKVYCKVHHAACGSTANKCDSDYRECELSCE
jgi:uncharacterized protein YraI